MVAPGGSVRKAIFSVVPRVMLPHAPRPTAMSIAAAIPDVFIPAPSPSFERFFATVRGL
jgi:hypothetical protein